MIGKDTFQKPEKPVQIQRKCRSGVELHAILGGDPTSTPTSNVATSQGKLIDFADVNESNMRWIQDFRMKSYANPAKLESIDEPICAVGHGVAALCCATNEDKSWVFQGYSLTGPSVYELIRQPSFASLSIIVEDFVKDSGATFSASKPDAVHVVLDRHLVTGQNENSTVVAVQNLILLCNGREHQML
ncbi:Parkinson disease 7 domain-containing protein 1 [Chelonia mydas]|uniref:Glutamine amidotransferase-like class 1 domain-containing protein 1 n=1 Tax=Chelonia mydas TaxID=8469 RepID=M7BC34_CHEMY|nr:Parkinson disease 7 domain-containing protein 1 [Chelonia mydas]